MLIAHIKWDDAWYIEDIDISDIKAGEPLESAGWLVKENADIIAIAMDLGPDGNFRHIQVIPKTYVTSIKYYGGGE